MDNKKQKFYNVRQAAEYLDVDDMTIRRWARKSILKGLKVGPRGDWRFKEDNLLDMVKGNKGELSEKQQEKAGKKSATVKKAEEKATRAEERYRLLVEGAKMYAIFFMDEKGYINGWNKGAEEIFGYKSNEIMGRNFSDIFTPEDKKKDMHKKELDEARRTGVADDERWHVRKDGTRFFAFGHLMPLVDKEGKLYGFSKLVRDLTERKRMERELENRVQQQKAVSELGLRALNGIDLQVLMEEACNVLAKTLNVSHSKVLEFLPEKKKFIFRAGIGWAEGIVGKKTLNAIENAQPGYALQFNKPVVFYDLASEKRFKGSPILFEHGIVSGMNVVISGKRGSPPFGILGTYSNVHRKFSQDDINFLQSIANVLAQAIERHSLEARKDEFIGVASHELKTPVTSLKSYTQILKKRFRERQDLESISFLARMEAQLNNLAQLVTDLLDVSKIQAGKLELNKAAFIFNNLVRATVDDIQRTTSSHRIELDIQKNFTCLGDEYRIGQVLVNFLTNAIKYSPQADRVVVKAWASGDKITVSIQDFGIGISKEKQGKIFEPFFRAVEGAKGHYPGLGLGLHISSQIVRAHGGEIWLESAEGQGSTFYFTIPRVIEKEKVKTEENKILVVDDNPAILDSLQVILQEAGYKVISDSSGQAIQKKIAEQKPVLILLDIWLPRANGGEIARQLKSNPKTRDIPIILLSAIPNAEKIARETTADDFLPKPFEMDDVIMKVEKYTKPERSTSTQSS